MSLSARHHWIITIASALVFFTNLGGPRLWDDDEPRNATCAREMLARSDWVVPTFNGELRTDKPVLLYWLIMGAYQVFGDNEFAARFWSAMAAVGTTFCTYHLGRKLFRPEVGLWASIAQATALWFGFTGRAATPDSILIVCMTFVMLWFVRTASPQTGLPQRWIDFLLMYAAMGLGVLAKGPVAVMLPGAALTIYLLASSKLPEINTTQPRNWWSWLDRVYLVARRLMPVNVLRAVWQLRPLMGICVVAAIALPWYVAVYIQTDGKWIEGFLGHHNLQRFTSPLNDHRGTIFYYVPSILAGFFPWSIFLPLSLWRGAGRLRAEEPQRKSYLFLFCWLGLYIGFFSLAGTKLPSYVLPAYPALAILVGAFLDRWFVRPGCEPKFWMRTAFVALAGIGAAGLIGLPIACSQLLPGERLIGLPGLIPLVGGLMALVLLELRKFRRSIIVVAGASVLTSTLIFGFVAMRISRFQNSEPLAKIARQISGDQPKVASLGIFSSSLVYYLGANVEPLDDVEQFKDFVAREPNGFVILTSTSYWHAKQWLPGDFAPLEREQRFLKDDEVLLIGRSQNSMARKQTSRETK